MIAENPEYTPKVAKLINLNDLNEEQRRAVEVFDKPLLVLAGAGSGKTRVITYKIAYILQNGMAFPWQILAVTFTNKAAKEMMERVSHMSPDVKDINIGTFHAICVKMLRKNADLIGFSKSFVILDSSDQKKIMKSILDEEGIDPKVYNAQSVLSFLSRIKEKFYSPDDLNSGIDQFPFFYKDIKIERIYKTYQERLKAMNAMDFDDLLFYATKLLAQNKEVLEQYRQKFRYILIDEYQDINTLQFKWFQLLTGDNKNVCCVGDDDQSIYGWRGADVSLILSFAKWFKGSEIIRLEQNYRSTGHILSTATAVISNNNNRHGKTLWTEANDGETVKITCYNDSKAEARDISAKINAYVKTWDKSYNSFAILVRASSQTRILEESLIASQIQYKILGGLRFYERREVKDILAYIKTLHGNPDDIAFERVLSVPKKGIGQSTIDKIYDFARKNGISLQNAAMDVSVGNMFGSDITIPRQALNSLSLFFKNLKKWKDQISSTNFIDTLSNVIEEIKYEEYLKDEDEDDVSGRMDNIQELLTSLQSFTSVDDFLEHVTLVSDQDDGGDDNHVKVMTIHTSKGLEFPIVFLPGWEDGLFPSARTVEESGETGIEEERRLAYVAITRAREELFISHARTRITFGTLQSSRESMFVNEIKKGAPNSIDFRDKSDFTDGPRKTSQFDSRRNSYSANSSAHLKTSENNFADEIKAVKQYLTKVKTNSPKIAEGTKVAHKTFGSGVVIKQVAGLIYEIQFSNGDVKSIRSDFLTIG